jgi:arylsulfatase
MLLSGVDNHRNGFGTMAGRLRNPPAANQVGKPGYEGYLNDRVVTIADLLQNAGYHTYMSGKWHMGDQEGYRPAQRGFEESYALIPGGDNHFPFEGLSKVPPSEEFKQEYRDNDVMVELPAEYYSSQMFTDKMLDYLAKPRTDGKPFFGYLAYTAPHSPLQAPQEYIDKYIDKYTKGWDKVRAARFQRQKKLGLLPKGLKLPDRWAHIPAWENSPSDQQAIDAKKMAVYAAMIDYMDMSMGRIVNYLKKKGLYDNTVIVFMSDNGPEGNNLMGGLSSIFEAAGFNNSLENIGNGSSCVSPAPGFAMVSNTPYYGAKASVGEGGIRNNLIVSYPGHISGHKTTAFTSVVDLFPTLLDYAGVSYPESYKGKTLLSLDGRNMRSLLEGKSTYVHNAKEAIGFEVFGTVNKSLFKGNWKILRLGDAPWGAVAGNPGAQPWKLFNLKRDPTETVDLSGKYPNRFNHMVKFYSRYETQVGFVSSVIPQPQPPTLKADGEETFDDMDLPKTWKEVFEY